MDKVIKRLGKVIRKTPLELNERLSKKYNCNVFLKREDMQISRSFKIRGAFNKILSLPLHDVKENGIVCASAGNHAQGVAIASSLYEIPCSIFIPENTPIQKVNRLEYISGETVQIFKTGESFDKCLLESQKFCSKNKSFFIHPFDDMDIILGQATVGYEIHEEIEPDIIVVPIGGGGLISGILHYNSQITSKTKIIGVEPDTCPSMKLSISNKKILDYPVVDMFVDGATVSRVGELPFSIVSESIEKILLTSVEELSTDVIDLFNNEGIISEPAGALSVSALSQIDNIQGKDVVCIISGGNQDMGRYPEIIDKSEQWKGNKEYFILSLNQIPGQLKKIVTDVLDNKHDIVRFEYIKKTNKLQGEVLIGIQSNDMNLEEIEDNLKRNNIIFRHLTKQDLLYSVLI